MPDNEFDFSVISIKDFETGLKAYLEQLEGELRGNRSFWDKIAWNLPFGIGGRGLEDVDDAMDRTFNDIMIAVEQYGLSPDVASALEPQVADIFRRVLQNRAKQDWRKQYTKDIAAWQKDVASLTQDQWRNQLAQQQQQFTQTRQTAQDVFAREQFDWRKQQAQQDLAFKQTQIASQESLRQQDLQAQKLNFQWQNLYRMMGAGGGVSADDLAGLQRERDLDVRTEEINERILNATNWVARENLQLQKERLAQQAGGSEATLDDLRDQAEANYLKAVKAEKVVNEQVSDPNNPLFGSDQAVQTIRAWKQSAGQQLNRLDVETANLFQQNFGGGAGENIPSPQVAAGVKVPDFLPRFVPGLEGREFIPQTGTTRGDIPLGETPSPQQFRQITPSQQQQLAGFWRFAGQKPEDIFTSMQQMAPRPLRLGRTFQAARQV